MSNTCPKCGCDVIDVRGTKYEYYEKCPLCLFTRGCTMCGESTADAYAKGRAEAIAELDAWRPLSVPPMGVKTVIVRDETPDGYRYHILTLRKVGSWQPTKQEWHTQPQWTDGVYVGEFYDVVMCLGTFRNPEWREVRP